MKWIKDSKAKLISIRKYEVLGFLNHQRCCRPNIIMRYFFFKSRYSDIQGFFWQLMITISSKYCTIYSIYAISRIYQRSGYQEHGTVVTSPYTWQSVSRVFWSIPDTIFVVRSRVCSSSFGLIRSEKYPTKTLSVSLRWLLLKDRHDDPFCYTRIYCARTPIAPSFRFSPTLRAALVTGPKILIFRFRNQRRDTDNNKIRLPYLLWINRGLNLRAWCSEHVSLPPINVKQMIGRCSAKASDRGLPQWPDQKTQIGKKMYVFIHFIWILVIVSHKNIHSFYQ